MLSLIVSPKRTERWVHLRQIAEFFDVADNSVDIFEKLLYNNNELQLHFRFLLKYRVTGDET